MDREATAAARPTCDAAQRRGRRAADQHLGQLDLLAQQLEHLARALLAARGEPPQRRAARQHRARPERERLHDVGAAADAAVDQHLDAALDRVDDLRAAPRSWRSLRRAGGRRGWRRSRPAAPCSQASAASSAGQDALHHHRQARPGGKLLEVVPPHRGVHQGEHVGRVSRPWPCPRRPQSSGPSRRPGSRIPCAGRARGAPAAARRPSGRSRRSRPPPPGRSGRGSRRGRGSSRAGTSAARRARPPPPRRGSRSPGSTAP